MAGSQSLSTQAAPGLLNLDDQLTCAVCTDILYQPLTLLDCLHTFCGSCLKEWFRWQAEKELASRQRDRTRAANVNPYTCPSCRASVRETRPNATVTTLLDMYTQANPGRIKSEDERREAERAYKPGEFILPELPTVEKDEDEDADVEAYERLMDEVLDQSMRDLNLSTRPGDRHTRDGGSNRAAETMGRQGVEREERRRRRSREGRPRDEQEISSNALAARNREETTGRTAAAIRRATNQLDRASSIRISQRLSELEVKDTEEDIMRQIVEEGLLDGIDLHNLDSRQEEVIIDRIARAYRRRQEHQTRAPRDQRARVQERSLPIRDVSSRQIPAPSAWQPRELQTTRSRSRSQGSRRSTEPDAREQRQGEIIANTGAPSAWQTRDIPQSRQRSSSQSSSRRAPSAERRVRRPSTVTTPSTRFVATTAINDGVEPLVFPQMQTQFTQPTRRATGPFVNQSVSQDWQALGALQTQQPVTDNGQHDVWTSVSSASPISTTPRGYNAQVIAQQPMLIAPRSTLILASARACLSCRKQNIEYKLHYSCYKCGPSAAPYTLCHRCYRLGKGCRHWFGFGHAAQARFERQATPGADLPHIMEPERYKLILPGNNTHTPPALPTATVLERGVFCSVCTGNSKARYWACNICNSGEWGYCDVCTSHGNHCTHPLLPLTCIFVPSSSTSSPLRSVPRLVAFTTPTTCALCNSAIPPSNISWSCNTCNSSYCVTCRRKHLPLPLGDERSTRTCPRGHHLEGIGPSSAEDANTARPKPPNSILKAVSDDGSDGGRQKLRVQALWTRVPDEGIRDELEFPRGAEIVDVLDINGEWAWGVYCGKGGLFPLKYCRVV